MEYMEQAMQQQIDGGMSEAERCYDEIAQLKAERDALAAQVETMREQLQIAHDCITCADETGYVQDVGFVDLEAVALELKLAIESTPQQCLRDVQAEAGRAGFVAGVNAHSNAKTFGAKFDRDSRADQYAAKVRQGGAE